jgi:hypothetical protein
MSKEEILQMLSTCETKEDFIKADAEIMKIKERGDNETAQFLWNQLFMFEEGVARNNFFKALRVPAEFLGRKDNDIN